MKRVHKIKIIKSKGQYYWQWLSHNGREICRSSEVYKTWRGCENGLMSVVGAVASGMYRVEDVGFERRKAKKRVSKIY